MMPAEPLVHPLEIDSLTLLTRDRVVDVGIEDEIRHGLRSSELDHPRQPDGSLVPLERVRERPGKCRFLVLIRRRAFAFQPAYRASITARIDR